MRENPVAYEIIFLPFVEDFSEKELREAQDTILYHLSTCTEFKINEKEMVNQFRVSFHNGQWCHFRTD